jgi:hypothetical protein
MALYAILGSIAAFYLTLIVQLALEIRQAKTLDRDPALLSRVR